MMRAVGRDLAEVSRGLSDVTLSQYSSDETKGDYIRKIHTVISRVTTLGSLVVQISTAGSPV
jgi:hypothetical protein